MISINDLSSPFMVAYVMTRSCNLKCLHCDVNAGMPLCYEMHNSEILKFCNEIIECDISHVALTGGEPLLHKNFYDVAHILSKAGIFLTLETNGTLINEKVAKKLSLFNFSEINISLDGLSPETHEKLRGVNGCLKKTLHALELLSKQSVCVNIEFAPVKFNWDKVSDVIHYVINKGVSSFITWKLEKIGRAYENWPMIGLSENEYKHYFEIVKSEENEHKSELNFIIYEKEFEEELRLRFQSPPASLLVLPNGEVKLSGVFPLSIGNVRELSLGELWEKYKVAWKDKSIRRFINQLIDVPQLRQRYDYYATIRV
ncbi:MAG: radical SAM/SPASM domain-containing protein [Thermoprotei archaeon]